MQGCDLALLKGGLVVACPKPMNLCDGGKPALIKGEMIWESGRTS
jgi:hypothetical protein